jgi:hypothetical protein
MKKDHSIRATAQLAKTLQATLTASSLAAAKTASSLAAAKTALTAERAQKFKTKAAKANQTGRIARLRAQVAIHAAAVRKTAADLRKAGRALERGPKAHLLAVDATRARAAGAHLDMTGKDARIIASWDDSQIIREPAKHVWKDSGTECYWSKGRSRDIEYVRATRDNHITSYCVISGRMARGVLHTTEWSLRAPAGMSWSVDKERHLCLSAPPSKLVSPLGRTILAPELPAITGLDQARESYRAAYARILDQQHARGPKVRAAVRAVSRRRRLGWQVGVEDYEGRPTAFAARRDGEKYHFRSADTIYQAAPIIALVETIAGAFARRDREKERVAAEAALAEVYQRGIATTRVTLLDSRLAGNCVEGSLAFAERKLGLSREDVIAAGYLLAVPASRLLAVANGDRTAVDRAIRMAWMRETTVSI